MGFWSLGRPHAVLACALTLLLVAEAEATPHLLIYATTTGSAPKLLTFRSNAPGTILSTQTITGLQGEVIVGLDVRPATGQPR